MNKSIFIRSVLYMVLTTSLTFSCANSQSSKRSTDISSTKQDSAQDSIFHNNNYLRYTSGIISIYHDSKGNYWFGSLSEGVCVYNGKNYEYYTADDGLIGNKIRSIQEDMLGNIWIGTARGVFSFDGEEFRNQTPMKDATSSKISDITSWDQKKHDLWFNGGNTKGVYRYDGQSLNYLSFPETKTTNLDNTYHSTGFSKGKDKIWMATYSGIFGYDGNEFTIINDKTLGLNDVKGFLHIRSVFEDSKGNLWIGNNGIGVLVYNGNTTVNFSMEKGLIHFLSKKRGDESVPGTLEHVFAIEEDRQGNIWFSDRDTGLWKYDGKTMTNYTMKDGLPKPLEWPNLDILCIYKDNNGELMFGLKNKGVYIFNGKSFERRY